MGGGRTVGDCQIGLVVTPVQGQWFKSHRVYHSARSVVQITQSVSQCKVSGSNHTECITVQGRWFKSHRGTININRQRKRAAIIIKCGPVMRRYRVDVRE